ncbi:hypothetical protein DFR41_110124 [Pseudacidovorax intermedius]|uniref:Uncharacterized protein n=1 Tax=Pseudacidovorax intermedius TaxID=433924 RepID=A0A370F867_9BURK|nr:hypothetical protein [Pseudacidovorax intermedius]RDI20716.1 hypothetical protein DFR41_110124 [Pseudacidovorax intermedius]
MSVTEISPLILESLGFQVQKIPTGVRKSADFLAIADGCRLLIEEKRKEDEESVLREKEEILGSGKIFESEASLEERNERLAEAVREGHRQLRDGDNPEHDFKILWINCDGVNPNAKYAQVLATLYGSVNLMQYGTTKLHDCIGYDYAEFYRRTALDAAACTIRFGDHVILKLLLNPYSTRAESLSTAPFVKRFPREGIYDPIQMERDGRIFIYKEDIKAKSGEKIKWLEDKYGCKPLHPVRFNRLTLISRTPL